MPALPWLLSYRAALWNISCGIQTFWVVLSHLKYETIFFFHFFPLLLKPSLICSILPILPFAPHERGPTAAVCFIPRPSLAEPSPVHHRTLLMSGTAFSLISHWFCAEVACLPVHSLYFTSIVSHGHLQVFNISILHTFYSPNLLDFPFCLFSILSSLRLPRQGVQLATSDGPLKWWQCFLLTFRVSALTGLASSSRCDCWD